MNVYLNGKQVTDSPDKVWDVISPDGFSIHLSDTYDTLEQAREAFKKWSKQYERQGYYSSARWGRISLHSLELNCRYVQIYKAIPDNDDKDETNFG